MFGSVERWIEFFERYYKSEINDLGAQEISNPGEPRILTVDVKKTLLMFNSMKLYEDFIKYPEQNIKNAELALKKTHNIHGAEIKNPKVRFVNFPSNYKKQLNDISEKDVNFFVSVEGVVNKLTQKTTRITKATFKCKICDDEIHLFPDKTYRPYNFKPPIKCRNCKSTYIYQYIPEQSERLLTQRARIQELPETVKGAREPVKIGLLLEEDLVGEIRIGDRVVVNGILKEDSVKSHNTLTNISMNWYIDVNSVEVKTKAFTELQISEHDRKKIEELSKSPDLYTRLVKSINPAIYGNDHIKLAIALQLFGAERKEVSGTVKRGDIHILLIGDPATAKSKLIKYVANIAPRCVVASGKGATGVGLTASVGRNEFGQWGVEAGAMVIADGGIVIIDEFDKLNKDDRDALHDAMEDQIIAINKAGLNMTLPARCSVLAAANPLASRFDPYTPISEQINLPASLLSRFDLIFVVRDEVGDEDENVLDAITRRFYRRDQVIPPIPVDLLMKYIAYAKQKIKDVTLPEEVERLAKEKFIALRRQSKDGTVSVTYRQYEAILRLAEASARARLSNVIEVEDIERAYTLLMEYLKEVVLDPETGDLDIDRHIATPKNLRDSLLAIKKIIEKLEDEDSNRKGVPEKAIVEEAVSAGIAEERAREIIHRLREKGEIYSPIPGRYKLVTT